ARVLPQGRHHRRPGHPLREARARPLRAPRHGGTAGRRPRSRRPLPAARDPGVPGQGHAAAGPGHHLDESHRGAALMPIQSPKLDDRAFDDLVEEAKQVIRQRCPEWSDLGASDPGVVLIELFAYLTDVMLYRLNRLPEKAYIE